MRPVSFFDSPHIANVRKHVILLLFIGYAFMGMLIMEQGRTISNQRTLIRDLFADSVELTTLKIREARSRAQ